MAAWDLRGVPLVAAAVHVFVPGSNSSALPSAPSPPTTVPLDIVATDAAIVNRPPNAITAVFDPPAFSASDVIFARVQSSLILRDPDFDIVRYHYQWKVNGVTIRDIVSAGLADAIPKGSASGNDFVTCTITPNDGKVDGPSTTISSIPPAVTSVSPAYDVIGGGKSVTITGRSFAASGVSFKFGGTPATSLNYVDSTTYTATVPAHSAGMANVDYSSGMETATLANGFTYYVTAPPNPPSLTGISPAAGSFLGNTLVTATGTNFVFGAKVFVNGAAAATVAVSNAATIVFRTPPGSSGQTVSVMVVNPDGGAATLPNSYTYDTTGRPPTFAAVAGSPCVPGAYFRYYEGTGPNIPNFAALPFSRVGAVPTAEHVPENTIVYPIRSSTGGNNFSLQYTGYLLIPSDGTYSFYTASDDASNMFIGGVQVAGNDLTQSITTRTGPPIKLRAGLHEYTVQYAEDVSGHGNYIGWGSADSTPAIPMDTGAVWNALNGTSTSHAGAPTTRIPAAQYYYIPPTWQAAGMCNWSDVSGWNANLPTSTNTGRDTFAPVQTTNDDDHAVDTVFRFNGNGVVPFGSNNDSVNNTPLYYIELNSDINGNAITGNAFKMLGAARFVQYNSSTLPAIVQNGSGTVNISSPIFNRSSLILSGNGSGVVTLSGTQTNYAAVADIKNIFKSGTSTFSIDGNASAYTGDGLSFTNGFIAIDGGILGVNATVGAAGPAAYNAKVGTSGTTGTLRGTGTISGSVQVGASGTVFPGDVASVTTAQVKGTLTAGSATFSNGGTLKIRALSSSVDSAPVADKLAAAALTLGGTSKLKLALTAPSGAYANRSVVIATGSISAPFSAFTIENAPGAVAGVSIAYRNATTIVAIQMPGFAASSSSFSADNIALVLNGSVTPVTVDSFTAQAEGAGVVVEWRAASEFQNAGFNLSRRAVGNTCWTRINPTLLPGRISNPDAKTYRYYDWAEPGEYEYKIESVGIDGRCEAYPNPAGPAIVDAAGPAMTSDGLDAAVASLELLGRTHRAGILSAQFAPFGLQREPLAAVAESGRPPALAFDAHGMLARPAEIRKLTVDSPVARARASDRSEAPELRPMLSARWFSSAAIGVSSFNAVKTVYSAPGVLLLPQKMLPAGFDTSRLSILREGRTLTPLARTATGLVVYAPGYQDDYTDKDALFLRRTATPAALGHETFAQGLFAGAQPAETESPASVTAGYHDVYFDFTLRPYDYAPWFSAQYLTGGAAQSFTLNLPGATQAAAALTVNLWSLTHENGDMSDHALQVLVNSQPVGQAQWSGEGMMQLTFAIPAGVLAPGLNQVELVTPAIAGVTSQIAFLHALTCNYARGLDGAKPLVIINTGVMAKLFEVSGLPGASAWVVDTRFPDRAALVPYETQAQANGSFKLRFVASAGGDGRFVVVPSGQENLPISMTRRVVKPAAAAVYWAVGPSAFQAGVQSLLMRRSGEGLRGAFIDQEAIFDFYGYGRYGPGAIQAAVRALRPQYLLLLGRTTYDYHNYGGLNVNTLCPTFLVSTTFWAQATSDSMFGDLGRGYSEVAVGRLPVNDPDELRVAVHRILAYPGVASGWRIHAVTDQNDPDVAHFGELASSIAQAHPDLAWQKNYLGVTHATAPEVTSALKIAASGGADMILYIGHGNSVRLGRVDPRILDTTLVQDWTGNDVFLQATCTANWMAKNENGFRSIAIQALTQPQGGISASIGSSTYTNAECVAEFTNQLLLNANKTGMRWGNALMYTQQWAHVQSGGGTGLYDDLSRTEQIFGDPAMPVFRKNASTYQQNPIQRGTGTF